MLARIGAEKRIEPQKSLLNFGVLIWDGLFGV